MRNRIVRCLFCLLVALILATPVLSAKEVVKEKAAEVVKEKAAEVVKEKAAEVVKEKAAEVDKEKAAEVDKEKAAEVVKEKAAEVAKEKAAEVAKEKAAEVAKEKAAEVVKEKAAEEVKEKAKAEVKDVKEAVKDKLFNIMVEKKRLTAEVESRKKEELKSVAGAAADVVAQYGLNAEDAAVLSGAAKKVGAPLEAVSKALKAADGNLDKALGLLGARVAEAKAEAEKDLKLAEVKRAKEHTKEALKATLKGEEAVGADEEEKAGLIEELKAVEAKLQENPDDGRLLTKAARINFLLGRMVEAKDLARVAAEKYEDKAPALALQALIAKKTGDSEGTLALLDQAIMRAKEEGEDAAELRALAGTLRVEKGDLKKAKDDLEEGFKADHKNPDLIAKLKEVYKKTAAPGLKVFVEGKKPNFDVAPRIVGGRTMVPLRAIAESLAAKVDYVAATRTVVFVRGNDKVEITIDVNVALVNGVKKALDVAPTIVDGRTLVPLRFISESLNAQVTYDGETGMITVDSAAAPVPAPATP